jgi:transcriptional regulator with GAF, ATPase, and Fis domain
MKMEHIMNENEFFRLVALCICSNLKIEKALQSCINTFKKVMPLDRFYLQSYDYGLGSMRTIATATESEHRELDQLTPLSEDARPSIGLKNLFTPNDVFIFDDPQKYAISREMLSYHDVPAASIMVLLLQSTEQILGSLVLITEDKTGYNPEHARMLSMLKDLFAIALSNTLKHREVLTLKDLLADDNRYLHGELRRISGDEIVGANFGLRDVMQKIQQVASLDSPVLLLGETGVGKDVIANAIHYSSSRSNGPFVSVNCGAIPDSLIDSELFGHEKGAFTGALAQKRGRFERANHGTIFLDEIGELPLQAQVRLLRVLQIREIERVGGVKTIPLDIRIIAATNRNLEEMVKTRQFREDLWFRLNVFPVWIPPLRDRRSDIPALLQHFISLKSKELKLTSVPVISPGAIDLLMDYHWPGNVRELQNVVERALILNPSGPLTFDHMNLSDHTEVTVSSQQPPLTENLDEVISQHIRSTLIKTGGKIHGSGGAAELLGINASTLRNRMNKLSIKYRKNSY